MRYEEGINIQAKIDEEYDSLSERCKRCKFLTPMLSCELMDTDWEEDCPLDGILCTECTQCYRLIRKDGEKLDICYCELNEKLMDENATACCEFEELQEVKND